MSNQNKESERLRRLRDQQLRTRDPKKGQRKISGRVSGQFKSRQKYTVKDGVKDVPHKWKGLLIGLIAGVLVWVLLVALVDADWVDMAGILAVLGLPILGFIFGSSFDWRDELRDV